MSRGRFDGVPTAAWTRLFGGIIAIGRELELLEDRYNRSARGLTRRLTRGSKWSFRDRDEI